MITRRLAPAYCNRLRRAVMSEIGQKCHSRYLHGLVGIEYWATNVSKNYLPAILCGIVFSISAGVGSAEDSAVQGKGQIDAKSFRCITEMTHVRQFYVDNLLGNLDATLAVANSATGGTYPPGSKPPAERARLTRRALRLRR